MNRDRLRDLLLQIAEILTLRGDAAIGIVPRRHQPAGPLVTQDLKGDFFHYLKLIIPYGCLDAV